MKQDIIPDTVAIKGIIREYDKEVYNHKFDKLDGMNQFFINHKLPKPNMTYII